MKEESLRQAMQVYEIESQCIREMADYFDINSFSRAVVWKAVDALFGCS